MRQTTYKTLLAMALILVVALGIAPASAFAVGNDLMAGEGMVASEATSSSGVESRLKPTLIELRRSYAAAEALNPAVDALWQTRPDLDAYTPGIMSQQASSFTLRYINLIRRAANLSQVRFDDKLNENAAYGALLLAKIDSGLVAWPHYTEDIIEHHRESGYAGRYACLSSSLAQASGTGNPLLQSLQDMSNDAGAINASSLKYRCWLLNPAMSTTGASSALSARGTLYTAVRTINYNDETPDWGMVESKGLVDYDFVAWPASGAFLSDMFPMGTSFSVSPNPTRFKQPKASDVQVKVTRLSDGASWTLDAADSAYTAKGEYFAVANGDEYGTPGCIIFNPGAANVGTAKYEGSYKVDITGLQRVSGEAASLSYEVDFADAHVELSARNTTVSGIADHEYTGSAIRPSVTVTCEGTVLAEGTDYTLSYADNVNAGTAHVTVKGIGAFSGTVETSFTITPKPIGKATIAGLGFMTFKGEYLQPTPTVALDGKQLKSGQDFTVSYADNFYVGSARLTITGRGNYKGSASATFGIAPAQISAATVSAAPSTFLHDGKEKRPSAVARLGSYALVVGQDYTLSYANNVNAGTGTMTLSGRGNFTGATTASFSIVKRAEMQVLAGSDRYDTARMIVDAELKMAPYRGIIVVAGDGEKFPDALSASGLSGMLDYPIVMVNGTGLTTANRKALDALKRANGGSALDVVIVGGTAAVSSKVEKDLSSWGKVSKRLAGETRYETNALIYEYGAERGTWSTNVAFIARGDAFPDALAIAPYLVWARAPIVLVKPTSAAVSAVPAKARKAITGARRVIALGGTAAVSAKMLDSAKAACAGKASSRLWGSDRYQTASKIVSWELSQGMTLEGAGVATGVSFPDALSSGFLLGRAGAVLCLAGPNSSDNTAMVSALKAAKAHSARMVTLGGTAAVPVAIRNQIAQAAGMSPITQ